MITDLNFKVLLVGDSADCRQRALDFVHSSGCFVVNDLSVGNFYFTREREMVKVSNEPGVHEYQQIWVNSANQPFTSKVACLTSELWCND